METTVGESTENTREMADEVNDGTSGQAKMEDWGRNGFDWIFLFELRIARIREFKFRRDQERSAWGARLFHSTKQKVF